MGKNLFGTSTQSVSWFGRRLPPVFFFFFNCCRLASWLSKEFVGNWSSLVSLLRLSAGAVYLFCSLWTENKVQCSISSKMTKWLLTRGVSFQVFLTHNFLMRLRSSDRIGYFIATLTKGSMMCHAFFSVTSPHHSLCFLVHNLYVISMPSFAFSWNISCIVFLLLRHMKHLVG